MARAALIFKQFDGGISTDLKVGIKNSHAYSQSIDFRVSPSQLTVLPKTVREDAGVVKDLIQNEVMVPDGTIYAIGSAGAFYKRTTAGVWSKEADVNIGTYGLDYRKDTDNIYIPTRKSVSLYNMVSSATPAMYMNYYGPSFSQFVPTSTTPYTTPYQIGSTKTYTLGTSILENQLNLRYFQSDIEPLTRISVFIPAAGKGTGDWTLTLHDGTNRVLGTSTVTNANLTNNTFNDFNFSSQIRIYVSPNQRTYHIHLTSTVADGKVTCATINDLSTCDLEVWADRLVQTNNGMHPMARFLQYECFGNGNYLSIWEPISDPPTNAEWQRHRLTFPMEYEVCGLAVQNEFLAIALEKTTSSNTSIPQEGIIAFWDGTAATSNYFVKVPEGSPQCIHEYKNVIYYFAGGSWFAIASPTTQPVKIRTMPNSDFTYSNSSSYIKVYPYAATVRRGVHLMAYPSETTNTSINYGVYSWGAVDKNFPESFGYNYLISTGNQNYSSQNNLTIGMVKNFGDLLHIAWRDSTDGNGGFGIDKVDNSSTPATTFSWQSLIFDNGSTTKIKKASALKIGFKPLPDGATITPAYSIGRNAWVTDQTFSNTNLYRGSTHMCQIDIPEGDFREIQVGFSGTATNTTPMITSIVFSFDDNREEARS